MGRKIYENNMLYTVLRPYVDWCTKHSYRRVEIRGEENLPKDGAILLAPNHCNTLMDALVVLRAYKGPTVFGARADMFNNPLLAKIMHFLRILPMVRQRDGLRNVLKNHDTQEMIVETLENGVRFCMYPEGRHRPARSLLPLGKGVFRAALAANAKFGEDRPVYIVPVGLEYGDYFRYRSTSLLTYGKPINVTEFVRELDVENEAQMIEPLRKELSSRMSQLITYIRDDDRLPEKWALTKVLTNGFRGTLAARMENRRKAVARIEDACDHMPEYLEKMLSKVEDFERKRRRSGISSFSFGKKRPVLNAIGKGLLALIGLPYYLFSAITTSPMWLTFGFLRGKIKDRAFQNTAGFGLKLAMGPLVFILWTVLSFCLLQWPLALAFSLLTIPAYSYFYDYKEFIRIYTSDLKLFGNGKLDKMYNSILSEAKEL